MQRVRVKQLALPLEVPEADLPLRIAKVLGIAGDAVSGLRIERKSVDARDKGDIRLVYGLSFTLDGKLPSSAGRLAEPAEDDEVWQLPAVRRISRSAPVVVGAGPAGLFAALVLAEAGLRPILLERGDRVEDRARAVKAFMGGSGLDPESNIQFGEGGAGTWSDGKLTTQVKDEAGRARKVLAEFIAAGAPEEIAWLAKPHLGTDKLVTIVAGIRRRIEALGGEVRFRSRVDGITVKDGAVAGLIVNGGTSLDTDTVILALGHSARDSFRMLAGLGLEMERKPFAIGLRIEHPQRMISESQFGSRWNHPALPVADYKLTAKSADGRGVYSFCMCPGGTVVNASSEPGGVVCNGMSDFSRKGRNANSALVVSVNPEDFGAEGLLAGIEFQRKWEEAAFRIAGAGYALPVQLLGDFLAGKRSSGFGQIKPAATTSTAFADLRDCLPPFVTRALAESMPRFGRMIRGFDRPDAVLSGVETRTSSPLRIRRGEEGESSIRGLYPSGEGAGYAGGIMSAAMDGIRAAEWVLQAAR